VTTIGRQRVSLRARRAALSKRGEDRRNVGRTRFQPATNPLGVRRTRWHLHRLCGRSPAANVALQLGTRLSAARLFEIGTWHLTEKSTQNVVSASCVRERLAPGRNCPPALDEVAVGLGCRAFDHFRSQPSASTMPTIQSDVYVHHLFSMRNPFARIFFKSNYVLRARRGVATQKGASSAPSMRAYDLRLHHRTGANGPIASEGMPSGCAKRALVNAAGLCATATPSSRRSNSQIRCRNSQFYRWMILSDTWSGN